MPCVNDAELLTDTDGLGVGGGVMVSDRELLLVWLRVQDGLSLTDGDSDVVTFSDGVALAVPDHVSVSIGESDSLAVDESDGDGDAVGDTVPRLRVLVLL